jgi:UvrD/REP helicase N-terminal domain
VEVISNLILSDMGLTLDPLLPIQRDAVTCDCEPLLVLGAAGTGKTRTLEGRFTWFVEQGCRPERVLPTRPGRASSLCSTAATTSCS